MKVKNANPGRLDILGSSRTSPKQGVEAAAGWLRQRNLGYFSMFAGAASIFAIGPQDASAKEVKGTAIPPRVARKAAEIVADLNAKCSTPELLRRQGNYLLPHQKGSYNMVDDLAGTDACPGLAIPGGVYTVAAPYTDSGDTTGKNSTVTLVQAGCHEYTTVAGPDHIYSFTLTARGAAPQIRMTTTSGTYDSAIYILNGSTGAMCPAGTGNSVSNCLVGADAGVGGGPETITTAEMNSLPLNVPLHLFVDSFYSAPGPSGATPAGPYTITMQDVTVAGGVMPPANDAPVDMNGDGSTDYTVIRNTGGGSSGQATWFTKFSNNVLDTANGWGIASDVFVPVDFDGDGKDDFAVWRAGANGVFYIVQSQTQTIRIEAFGQTGDDPTVVGDYTGDNRDDLAVYRAGATAGAQSTWYYRSLTAPSGTFVAVNWGRNGHFPAPGDYDGDNRNDFVVQTPDGVNAVFYKLMATGAVSSEYFGLFTDTIAPGDFDDDAKTDLSVVRNENGFFSWYFEPSGTAGTTAVRDVWGVAATDVITQGDYNGDGRTEYSVWRPGSPSIFYQMTVGTRAISMVQWGQAADVPVANYNVH